MTPDRYGEAEPIYGLDGEPFEGYPAEVEPEELDENGNQLSRLTPTAREWLAHARASLARPSDQRRP